MSLSTLRVRLPPMHARDSLTSLTDDNLLLLLRFLSVPQLLAFLSLSRRFNRLIVQFTLPHYRAILMQVTRISLPAGDPPHMPNGRFEQFFSFSRRFHRHTGIFFSQSIDRLPVKALRSRQLHQTLSSSLPIHLPQLLPRLQSLTFAYYIHEEPLSRESVGNGPFNDEFEALWARRISKRPLHIEPASNGPLIGYLQSHWRQSLVSLELNLLSEGFGQGPLSGELLFNQLNQLSALRHLSLLFSYGFRFIERIIPDSMPVLGQLDSFALYRYKAPNVPTLLRQLGPNLRSLSLYLVICSEEDFLSFLSSKPTYRQTLRTLEIHLSKWYPTEGARHNTPRLSTLANYGLPLEHLLSSYSVLAVRLKNK